MPNPFAELGVEGGGGTGNPFSKLGSSGGNSGGLLPPGLAPGHFATTTKNPKQGWGDVLGNIGNQITGIPAGFKYIATHNPVNTVEEAAQGTYNWWKPAVVGWEDQLLHGPSLIDVIRGKPLTTKKYRESKDKFDQNFYKQPLEVLDLLFGAGAVGSRTLALGKLGEAGAVTPAAIRHAALTGRTEGPLRTINVRGAEGGETIPTRTLPRNAWRAARMEKTDSLLKLLNPNTPKLGEFSRAARAAKRTERVAYLRAVSSPEFFSYQKAYKKLGKHERAAFKQIVELTLSKDLQAYKEGLSLKGTKEATQTLRVLNNPKVMEAYTNPRPELLDAIEKGRSMMDMRAELLGNALDPNEAILSPYRHLRTVRGAEILTKGSAYTAMRAVDAALTDIGYGKKRLLRAGTKAGRADIKQAIKEGRDASKEAAQASTARRDLRAELEKNGSTVDALWEHASNLRTQIEEVMNGVTDLNTLQEYGHTPQAHRPALEIPKRYAAQLPEERLSQLIKTGFDSEHARQIMEAERGITVLKKEIRNTNLKGVRTRMERRLAKRQTAYEELVARASAETGTSGFDLAGQRIHVLGQLFDQLDPATKLFEKALLAEAKLEKETMRGMEAAERQLTSKQSLAAAREKRIKILQAQRAKFNDLLEFQHNLLMLKDELDASKGKLYGGGTPESLSAEIAKAGRPQPYYIPDVSALKEKRRFASPEGSISAQRARADIYSSMGVLFREGMIVHHQDVLTPSYLRAAKHQFYVALHKKTMELAIEIPRSEGLPENMEWVRKRRGEKIAYTETYRNEHLKETGDVYGGDLHEAQELTFNKDKETPRNEDIAEGPNRNRLAIASSYADEFRADFARTDSLIGKITERTMDIWRALILHLRIPWLENNIFGNAMLTAVRTAGIDGMRAVLSSVYEMKGPAAVRRMLGQDFVRQNLTDADMVRVLPEQMRGTGVETQFPRPIIGGLPDRVEKASQIPVVAGRAVVRALPTADKYVERKMRKYYTNVLLRGSDEAKALYKGMDKQSRSWREASVQAMEDNPALRDLVSREVNDALGDFLSLSRKERTAIRRLIPFYAWFREITRIATHLVVDAPGRAAILAKIGQIGSEEIPQDVPSFMKGSIPIGGHNGLVTSLNLHNANPYSTVVDEARTLGALIPGSNEFQRNDLAGNFNPLIAGVIRQYALGQSRWGLPGQAIVDTVKGLPQVRAALNPDSVLYPERSRMDLIKQLAGDYRRTYDPDIASYQHDQGK